jgi:hypothetical protein
MSAARWVRLAADLNAAGVIAGLSEKSYSERVYGRVRHGISRSFTIDHPRGGVIEIDDGWWSKNPEVWIGWRVTHSGFDGIIVDQSRHTKRRSEVVSAVNAMLVQEKRAAPHPEHPRRDGASGRVARRPLRPHPRPAVGTRTRRAGRNRRRANSRRCAHRASWLSAWTGPLKCVCAPNGTRRGGAE